MINYDQGDGVQVEVSGVSNKSMKSVLTMTNIAITQVSPGLINPIQTNVPSHSQLNRINHRLRHWARECFGLALEISNFQLFTICRRAPTPAPPPWRGRTRSMSPWSTTSRRCLSPWSTARPTRPAPCQSFSYLQFLPWLLKCFKWFMIFMVY